MSFSRLSACNFRKMKMMNYGGKKMTTNCGGFQFKQDAYKTTKMIFISVIIGIVMVLWWKVGRVMAVGNFTTTFLREGTEVVVYLDHLYIKTKTGRMGQVICKSSFSSGCFKAFYYRLHTIDAKEKASSAKPVEKSTQTNPIPFT